MNILIAPDSFKNSLSAAGVAEAIRNGLKKAIPDADIRTLPMADGGEGTVESVVTATGGRYLSIQARDPLSRDVTAAIGISGDGKSAVIEMAAASGIGLLNAGEMDPLQTSSFGTGQLIRAALDDGCKRILMGIGGSATNDFGAGMAQALGVRFLDAGGKEVEITGASLAEVSEIDMTGLDPRIARTRIMVACDVNNPLTGPDGAAYVYAPQKGAGPEVVKQLDLNLVHMAALVREKLDREVEQLPGAGAAGGMGAGLTAFLDAELTRGVDAVAEIVGLRGNISWADLVITGEGRLDSQTLNGKTPLGVARIAREYGKPVIALAGEVARGAELLYDQGIDVMFSILDEPMKLEEAIGRTRELLETESERIGRFLRLLVRH